jgi:heme-degrading monooxygenase HmoA
MRYARRVDFNLKTGQEKEFNQILETKIVPMLQKQKGFQDELVLTAGRQVTAISLWDTRQNAEGYDKATYPKVLEFIKPLAEATPKVQVCDVPHTTFHATV